MDRSFYIFLPFIFSRFIILITYIRNVGKFDLEDLLFCLITADLIFLTVIIGLIGNIFDEVSNMLYNVLSFFHSLVTKNK